MNIPEKIKIGWKEYAIIKKDYDSDLVSGGDECYGQIFPSTRKLYINNCYDDEQKKATLIHEVLHGMDDIWGIDLKEEQVETLANAIYTVIKDNPKIFKEE